MVMAQTSANKMDCLNLRSFEQEAENDRIN
jgi:hypothetical protein